MDKEKLENIEKWVEKTYFETRWLAQNQARPVNYLVVIVVSMLSSALIAWLFTH